MNTFFYYLRGYKTIVKMYMQHNQTLFQPRNNKCDISMYLFLNVHLISNTHLILHYYWQSTHPSAEINKQGVNVLLMLSTSRMPKGNSLHM